MGNVYSSLGLMRTLGTVCVITGCLDDEKENISGIFDQMNLNKAEKIMPICE